MKAKLKNKTIETDASEKGESTSRSREYALCYFRKGLVPIPLKHGTKDRPLIKWRRYQTERPTEDKIREWFPPDEERNIALIMGEISGLVVIDGDTPEAVEFCKKNLPRTSWETETPNGRHFGCRHPGVRVASGVNVSILGERLGFDIRADGSYVVAPPSLHPSGGFYEATFDLSNINMEDIPIFDPGWIDDPPPDANTGNGQRADTPAIGEDLDQKIRAYIGKKPGVVEGSGGDVTVFQMACDLLLGFSLNKEEALPYLKEWTEKWKVPGDEAYLIKKLLSAEKNGKGGDGYLLHGEEDRLYFVHEGKLHFSKAGKYGSVPVALSNCDIWIAHVEVFHDSLEEMIYFVIEGKSCDGIVFPKAVIPASQFATLNWISEKWGPEAIIYAGNQVNKDHLRAAIQIRSKNIKRVDIYPHTGWIRHGNQWLYLHGDGAIGENGKPEGIEVDLGDSRLNQFRLPEPPEGEALRKAIRTSLSFCKLGPHRITYPLLFSVYAAPLGVAISLDFSLHLVGPTRVGKSTFLGMAQAHYGKDFNRLRPITTWLSTANSNERLAHLAAHATITVDDFCPEGAGSSLHRDADRLFRAQGNQSGRIRMSRDGKLKMANDPRGGIHSSGEDVPRGESVKTRIIIIDVISGDLNLGQLSRIEKAAAKGVLAQSMAGYLKWLAPQIEDLRQTLPAEKEELRELVGRELGLKHTPELVASLYVSLDTFLKFALHAGAISQKEQDEYWNEGIQALTETTELQAFHQTTDDPAKKFQELLDAAFILGRAHLVDATDGRRPAYSERFGWQKDTQDLSSPKGEKIGWFNGREILLQPDAVLAVIQKLARDQGTPFVINKETLWKRLAQAQVIKSGGKEGKNLPKRMAEGSRRRVLVLPFEAPDAPQAPKAKWF